MCLLSLVLIWPLSVMAEEPTMDEFARGYELKTGGGAAIYKLSLPAEVYRTVVSTEFNDVRVYNRDKIPVPHVIRHPELENINGADTQTPSFTPQSQQSKATIRHFDAKNYEFDLRGAFPVFRMKVLFPKGNSLMEATLRSRPNEKAEWRMHYRGLFYRLEAAENLTSSDGINIRKTTDRYWQLVVKTENGLGTTLPVLEFTWQPDDLYFLAQGQAPFKLVFGNRQIKTSDQAMGVLMDTLIQQQERDFIDLATLGPKLNLMGDAALKPGFIVPWRRFLLWTILVATVLLLSVMALHLYKQIPPRGRADLYRDEKIDDSG